MYCVCVCQVMPGVKVVVANPSTLGQCADSHLGEIWVASEHNSTGFYAVFGAQPQQSTQQSTPSPDGSAPARLTAAANSPTVHPATPAVAVALAPAAIPIHFRDDSFTAQLSVSAGDVQNVQTRFARTGWMGFICRMDTVRLDGGRHDALFVLGALEETVLLRGLRYHPTDMESTVEKKLAEVQSRKQTLQTLQSQQTLHSQQSQSQQSLKQLECAVFAYQELLCVLVEWDSKAADSDGLELLPLLTNAILEEHQLILGVLVILEPGTIPVNSRGEKQRRHIQESFLADRLDATYVAYNI